MRVIVVNDSDGHAHVFEFSIPNLRKCLQHLVDVGRIDDVDKAKDFINCQPMFNDEGDWITGVVSLLHEEYVLDRSGGGSLYFVDVKEDWNFTYGPFE